MSAETFPQLREAYLLLKAGDHEAAMPILTAVLKEDQENIDAWWMASFAADSERKKQLALEQVLRLNPQHRQALQMLRELTGAQPPAPTRQKTDSAKRKVRWGYVFAAVIGLIGLSLGPLIFLDNLTGCNIICPIYDSIFGEAEALGWVHTSRGGQVGPDVDRDDRIPVVKEKQVSYGTTQTDTLEAGKAHRYNFNARRGDQIVIVVGCANNGNPSVNALELWDARGNVIAEELDDIPFEVPLIEGRILLYEHVIRDAAYSLVIVSRDHGPSGTYTALISTIDRVLEEY